MSIITMSIMLINLYEFHSSLFRKHQEIPNTAQILNSKNDSKVTSEDVDKCFTILRLITPVFVVFIYIMIKSC